MGAYFLLPEKAKELPIIIYDSSLEFIISSDAKMMGVSVFSDDLERTHHRIDDSEFFRVCKNLEAGTYYVSVVVSYKGKYIEKEDKYESFTDKYIFRMDVDEESPAEEKDEDLYVTVAPPQFQSEEEFLEEVRLIKNDKEKEKSIVEGKLLAEMESYYMPMAALNGYELYMITITSEVFHLLYLEKGQEYSVDKVYELGYFYRNSDLTLKEVIGNTHHVQSQYSDRLYFYLNESYGEYRLAHYELDGIVFYLRLPYGVNLDDKKQIAEIENLCRMVKKNIED